MSYVDRVVQPGEEIVYRAPLHWVLYVPGWLIGGVAVALMAWGLTSISTPTVAAHDVIPWSIVIVGAFAFLAATLSLARAFIHRHTTEIAVTSRRVIYKTGLMRRLTSELSVEKIETVLVEQGILGRILNFGTVMVRGTGGGMEPVANIEDPLTFRSKLTAR